MAQVAAILERLARREREVRALPPDDAGGAKAANVHLADVVELVPRGVPLDLWTSWSEDARYTFHERLGIGDELGMDEREARRWAVIEAKLTAADVPRSLRPLLREALDILEGFTLELGSET